MAIVWICGLSVEAYASAGRDVVVPRPCCPACHLSMVFWSGYWRKVRVRGVLAVATLVRRIWVRRGRCSGCQVSHVLLPSFCLPARRYTVDVIGPAVEKRVEGMGTRKVAGAIGVWQSTVRTWCCRHRERAELALAVSVMIAASLGWSVVVVAASVEAAVLSALDAVVAVACEAEGLSYWPAISVVTGGMWLAPVNVATSPRSRVFSDVSEERLMAVIDRDEEERPP